MTFSRGDKVEVCSKQEGFVGSYYVATVIKNYGNEYAGQYKNLVAEDDRSHPLIETGQGHLKFWQLGFMHLMWWMRLITMVGGWARFLGGEGPIVTMFSLMLTGLRFLIQPLI